jgi:GWxTD domain-containing protein
MKKSAFLPLLVLLAGIPAPLAGQDLAHQRLQEALAQVAAGDTLAALVKLRWVAKAAPRWAEAHYQLGRLLARHASWVEADFRQRRQAHKVLDHAIRLEPDNPVYLAEYGMLLLKEHALNDSRRVLNRARRRLEERGAENDAALAEVYFALGEIEEMNYERMRDRRLVLPYRVTSMTACMEGTADFPSGGGVIPIGYAPGMLKHCMEQVRANMPPLEGAGAEHRNGMFEYYWTALQYDPNHREARRRLLLFLLEEGQMDGYLALANDFLDRHRDRPEGYLYLGLGLHALGREAAADSAFARGLAALPEDERAVFQDLTQVLHPRLTRKYARMDDLQRARFHELFWRINDPLHMTEANEYKLEHLSRMAYVDLRFSAPAVGKRGWETDAGIIYLRYGPPDEILRGNLFKGAQRVTWMYDIGLAFEFKQMPTYYDTRFAENFEWYANQDRAILPTLFANIASVPMVLDMPLQLARFRGDSAGEVALEIYCDLPLEELGDSVDLDSSEIDTYLFLLNLDAREIVRHAKTQVRSYDNADATNPLRAWRVLVPGEGKVRVVAETRDATTWRAAVARDTLSLQFFPKDRLSLSDLLLADGIRPLARNPSRRADFDVAGTPTLTYAPNQAVYVYYEIYGLEADEDGFARFTISLTVRVKSLAGGGSITDLIRSLGRAWGFTRVGDDWIELSFEREADVARADRVADHINFILYRAPPGEYELTITVEDEISGDVSSRRRSFTVTEDGPTATM